MSMSRVAALVLLAGVYAVAALEIDVTKAGFPLVDGPGPHKRLNTTNYLPMDGLRPLVIGHRGNCGEFPEHSGPSYLSAINHGADFIECDVCLTKDYKPICRHEPLLSNTTNADDIFPGKIRTYFIDGSNSTGVHVIDLTLKEILMLSVRERLYSRSQIYNDHFPIVTFAQQIKMVKSAPRPVGIYPETKHPKWHDSVIKSRGGKTSITQVVLTMLKKHGYDNEAGSAEWLAHPVLLQSFEVDNLKAARSGCKLPFIQLMDDYTTPVADGSYATYGDMMIDESLAAIAKYAYGIGPWKETLVNMTDGKLTSTGLVERAHKHGLNVHLYTLRNEANYHTKTLVSIADEYAFYFKTLGVQGGFTDFPGTLIQWIRNETSMGTVWPSLV